MQRNQVEAIYFFIQRQKYSEALAAVHQALTSNPDAAIFHALRAEVLYHTNKSKDALASINVAIGLEADYAFYHFWKARILLELDRGKEALQVIDFAISLDPEEANYYGIKALIKLKFEKKKEAITIANEGLERDPDSHLCKNVLSMALNQSGKMDESRVVLDEMLADDPEDAFTHTNMGYTYLRKREVEKAKEHFKAALIIDPTNEHTRAGMKEAIKATNYFYRQIIGYAVWMEKLAPNMRTGLIIGLVVLVRIVPFLAPLYLIFVLWVWFAPPLANVVLFFDKSGKYLMERDEMLSTQVNIGLIGLSLMSLILGLLIKPSFLLLAFGSFAAIVPVNLVHTRYKRRNKIFMILAATSFVGIGFAASLSSIIGSGAPPLGAGLLIAVILFTWIANIFKE